MTPLTILFFIPLLFLNACNSVNDQHLYTLHVKTIRHPAYKGLVFLSSCKLLNLHHAVFK